MKNESGYTWKLGMFVIIGVVLFAATVYYVGKQNNLFGSTFHLKTKFKTVSGLQVGNNVRFSGINVGTVSEIELVSDSSVVVYVVIQEEIQKFIKKDAVASIGSDGLMGDKVLTISPGMTSNKMVVDNDFIISKAPIDMEDVMSSVKKSVDNAGVITKELAEFSSKMNNNDGALSKMMTDKNFALKIDKMTANLESSTNEFAKFTYKMNNNKGALSKLVTDEKMGNTIDSTLTHLNTGIKGFSDNMEALKHNFLFRGYFRKQEKIEDKKQDELDKLEEEKFQKDLNKP